MNSFAKLYHFYNYNITLQNELSKKLILTDLFRFMNSVFEQIPISDNDPQIDDYQKLKYISFIVDPITIYSIFKLTNNTVPNDYFSFASMLELQINKKTPKASNNVLSDYTISMYYNMELLTIFD